MQKLVVLWLTSLVIVAIFATALARAQAPQLEFRILSGNDLGFRIEGADRAGGPIGALMVRINGEWVQVGFMQGVRPAH